MSGLGPRLAGAAGRRLALAAVLGASVLLDAWGLGWGLAGEHGWAPDELLPSAVRSGLDQRFSSGWHEKYGPFHYAVLAAAYQPALLARRVGLIRADGPDLDHILAVFGRLVSLLMATGAVWLVARLGRELGDEWAGIFAAAFLAFNAPFVYYAKIANLDAPYLFWYALSLLFYVRLLGRHHMWDYVLFAASAAAAVATKDQAYGLYVLTAPVVAGALHARRRSEGDRRLWATLVDPRLVIAAAVGLVVLLVLDNVVFNPEGFVAHLRLIAGPASHPFRMFTNDLPGHWALMRQTVRHLAFAMGLPALLVCGAGVAAALARPRANARWLLLLVPPLSYVATFLHVVLYGYDRFVLPVSLVLGLFGGVFLARGLRAAPPLRAAAAVLGVAVLAYSLLYAASVDRLLTHDSRYEVERWMARNIPPGAMVAAIGPLGYLPRLDGLRWRTLGPSVARLVQVRPDYVLVNADYAARADPGTGERELYDTLFSGRLGYRLARRERTPPGWSLIDPAALGRDAPDRIFSNLDKVNPEICVFVRVAR
jgi:4-amino-4-deoxy-L-arabinose transferase-like glycosyltransferase